MDKPHKPEPFLGRETSLGCLAAAFIGANSFRFNRVHNSLASYLHTVSTRKSHSWSDVPVYDIAVLVLVEVILRGRCFSSDGKSLHDMMP